LDESCYEHHDVRVLLEHDAYSGEFRRLLCVAQNGGATVSECVSAASLIIRANGGRSWRRAWEDLAGSHLRRAELARRAGDLPTAQSSWLHAANYFMAAAIEDEPEGADEAQGFRLLARKCLRLYLDNLRPRGETVTIPWLDGRDLEGFYLPTGLPGARPAPVAVCVAESRRNKEEILSLVARSARQRGMALLCVDLPGTADDSGRGPGRPETGISAIVDYLVDKPGVDAARIAVLGDGSPSSIVAKGVGRDGRVAAAVCDGGLWELWEHEQTSKPAAQLGMVQAAPIVPPVHCPMLIPLRAGDSIDPVHARRLLADRHPSNNNIVLKVLGDSQAESWEMAGYDPILAADFIFDWLDRQFHRRHDAETGIVRRFAPRL
jgi:dienelactone hydrolase